MKVLVKTLEGKQHTIEVEASFSVGQLKDKVASTLSVPREQQKLIFKGKVLAVDDVTLDSLPVVENDFFVLMVSKTKPAATAAAATPAAATTTAAAAAPTPAPAAAASTAAPTPAVASTPAPAPAGSTAAATPAATTASSAAPAAPARAAASTLSAEVERQVSQIVEMGFPRDEVIRAMRAAFNNPDRAVDYLMNGIPDNVAPAPEARPQPTPSSGSAGSGASAAAPAPAATPAGGAAARASGSAAQQLPSASELMEIASLLQRGRDGLQQLTDAQIQRLHTVCIVHANAQMQMAERLGTGRAGGSSASSGSSGGQQQLQQQQQQQQQQGADPFADLRRQLAATPGFQQIRMLVRQNPQLMQPLLQQAAQSNPQLMQLIRQNPEAFMQLLIGDDETGELPQNVVQVTQEERDALERLSQLGFPRQLVLQAYFACDKNEQLAANYLLEHGHDFDDDGDGDDDDDGDDGDDNMRRD